MLDQVAFRVQRRLRDDYLTDVMAPAVVFHELRRVLVGDVGALRNRPAHQRPQPRKVRLRPLELLSRQVVAHRALQRRVAVVPVETGRAQKALRLVALGLLRRVERQRVYAFRRVPGRALRSLSAGAFWFCFNRHDSPLIARVRLPAEFVQSTA